MYANSVCSASANEPYHRVHGAELAEIVFVGRVVAVPCHYIERREGLGSREELALILLHDQVVTALVLIPRHWCLEVARICQPIAAYTSIQQLTLRVKVKVKRKLRCCWKAGLNKLSTCKLTGQARRIHINALVFYSCSLYQHTGQWDLHLTNLKS